MENRSFSSQQGSVFTILLAAVGLTAVLSTTMYQVLTGPVATTSRITKKSIADTQMLSASKLIIVDAANQPASGDCDNDTFIEPREWRTGDGPVGGGLIPLEIGAPVTDPWGTDYGYCVWDVGAARKDALCGGTAARRLIGTDNPTTGSGISQTVVAIISAGPDRIFQSSCRDYLNGTTDVIIADGDDIIMRYSYAEAATATSSLWQLKVDDPGTATIGRDLEVGDGATTGIIQALALNTIDKVIAGGGLQLGDENAIGAGACTISTVGLMRFNSATGGIEICNVAEEWAAVTGGGGGASDIDSLEDGIANYTQKNIFLGEGAGNETAAASATNSLGIGVGALGALTTGANNVSMGIDSLRSATTAQSNIALGTEALQSVTWSGNHVAIGHGALSSYLGDINGDHRGSVAIGYNALQNLVAGDINTAIGSEAMSNSRDTSANVAIGLSAMFASEGGSQNIAIGVAPMVSSVGAQRNIALGTRALNRSTGQDNVAIGYWAMSQKGAGNDNVGIGNYAMYNNDTGSNNVAIGHHALRNNTLASGNIAIGNQALRTLGTDDIPASRAGLNVAIGPYMTSWQMREGRRNVAIGEQTLSIRKGNDNVAIGYRAGGRSAEGVEVNETVAIGLDSLARFGGDGNTAVGAYTGGDVWCSPTCPQPTGQYNTLMGFRAGYSIDTGSYNTLIGTRASQNLKTGSNNVAVGYLANISASVSNAIALGYNTNVSASNTVRIGNSQITAATINVPFSSPSDMRLKKDIVDSDLGLDFIQSLRPVSYRFKDGNQRIDYGFLAQEVEKSLEGRKTNMITRENNEDETYILRHTDLIAPIVKAMQEQQAMIDELRAQVNQLSQKTCNNAN